MGKICRNCFGFFIEIAFICLPMVVSMIFSELTFFRNECAYAANGSSYIVMRADTKEIFAESNKDLRLPMASTTKTMTALIAVENCSLDEIVVIPDEAVDVEGSSVYLKKGDRYTVGELLYGLMLRSGNDAAVALALHVAGSVENFAEMMNLRAESLGLENTRFVNPHGLHDKNHYTSAYDLAVIGCEAMENDLFRKIVSTKFITVGSGDDKKYWANKNKILSVYDGGNGIKTGYTTDSGRCLIASATRNGVTVVSVVLNRYDMFNDCCKLMDKAFETINKS